MDELFTAAEAYDADGDELLTEEEFRALADERRQELPSTPEMRMMGEFDPWEPLTLALDTDGDGGISFAELGFFFEANDGQGDFVWDVGTVESASPPPSTQPGSGPRVGTLAPDFSLSPPEGGEVVRLSSFRGQRPVALVFGSAT